MTLYTVKRYIVETLEVQVDDGETLTRGEILDRAEDPHSVEIIRETLRRKRVTPHKQCSASTAR
jgi:hypothetical protein